MIRCGRMRAKGIAIATPLSPGGRAAPRTASQVAVDQWLAAIGQAGADILHRYRRRR